MASIDEHTKILLQLSGGKDSTACLVKLANSHAKFEAIHFVHKYSYKIPTEQAVSICKRFNVPIHIVDVTEEIQRAFIANEFWDRPCRTCKTIMDGKTVDYAVKNGFSLICVGDNKDDSMLFNRLKSKANGEPCSFEFSSYFNKNIKLPKNIQIYRPLYNMDSKMVLSYLSSNQVVLMRVGDTGDKYFEYSREGCPLQFKDFGVSYTNDIMEKLLAYNTICSEYARKTGIRASIHLPSCFIVTIPAGHEEECRQYLIEHGCDIKNRDSVKNDTPMMFIHVKAYSDLFKADVLAALADRFVERLGEKTSEAKNVSEYSYRKTENGFLLILPQKSELSFDIFAFGIAKDKNFFENLLLELFHTRDFIIKDKLNEEN